MVAVAVVFTGGGFWGGMNYASGQRASFSGGTFAGRTGGTGRTNGMNGAFGTIIAKDASSITVQLGGPNATSTNSSSTGTRIVLYGDTTQIEKTVSGSAGDLTVGTSVLVNGASNSDGSITASSIQIRPAAGQGPMRASGQ